MAVIESLIDLSDFEQLKTFVCRGGVPISEAHLVRNEIIGRRLSCISGFTPEDWKQCTEATVAHITDEECRELLKILDDWPDDDDS
jgi:hypothetical protein